MQVRSLALTLVRPSRSCHARGVSLVQSAGIDTAAAVSHHGLSTARCAIAAPAPAKPKVILLAGPTGIGKTHLSLQLARDLNGEVVSADSVQQYRGLDIGSAKVTSSQRAAVPHHCIDTATISNPVSVADYADQAHAAVRDIVARGRTPIVVGGSGFYLRWLLHPPHAPLLTPSIKQLAAELVDDPRPWTEKLDTAAPLQPSGKSYLLQLAHESADNRARLQHYVELVLAAGGERPHAYVPPTIDDVRALPYDYRCFYLTCDREWLNRWTDLRCERMVQEGLLEEVKRLELLENLSSQPTIATAIGYRQSLDYLATIPSLSSSSSSSTASSHAAAPLPSSLLPGVHGFGAFMSTFQSASRALVRRQDIWFRKEPFFQFVHVATPTLPTFPCALADLEATALPAATWTHLQEHVTSQVDLDEQTYWTSDQWGNASRLPTIENESANSSTSAASPTSALASSRPSSALFSSPSADADATTSLQQSLRWQTTLSVKATQQHRRRYTSHLFHFGPHDRDGRRGAAAAARPSRTVEQLVRRVAGYEPTREATSDSKHLVDSSP